MTDTPATGYTVKWSRVTASTGLRQREFDDLAAAQAFMTSLMTSGVSPSDIALYANLAADTPGGES